MSSYIYPQTERGSPGGAVVKNPPANAGDAREAGSIPGSGQGSLAGYCPWGHKESDTTEHAHTRS